MTKNCVVYTPVSFYSPLRPASHRPSPSEALAQYSRTHEVEAAHLEATTKGKTTRPTRNRNGAVRWKHDRPDEVCDGKARRRADVVRYGGPPLLLTRITVSCRSQEYYPPAEKRCDRVKPRATSATFTRSGAGARILATDLAGGGEAHEGQTAPHLPSRRSARNYQRWSA